MARPDSLGDKTSIGEQAELGERCLQRKLGQLFRESENTAHILGYYKEETSLAETGFFIVKRCECYLLDNDEKPVL